jgi:hypothetical protein
MELSPMSSWHEAELSAGATVYFYSTDMCYELGYELSDEYHLVNNTDFHFLLVFPLCLSFPLPYSFPFLTWYHKVYSMYFVSVQP